MRRKKLTHPRALLVQRNDVPIFPKDGDELFFTGVFCFNISAMQEWQKKNPQPVVEVPADIWGIFTNKEDRYVEVADLTRPILIAEIAPDYREFVPVIPEQDWIARGYVCIDGQHRVEKARRNGITTLPAVVLRMEQHIPFLYSGYDKYVDYWNHKLADRMADGQKYVLPGS